MKGLAKLTTDEDEIFGATTAVKQASAELLAQLQQRVSYDRPTMRWEVPPAEAIAKAYAQSQSRPSGAYAQVTPRTRRNEDTAPPTSGAVAKSSRVDKATIAASQERTVRWTSPPADVKDERTMKVATAEVRGGPKRSQRRELPAATARPSDGSLDPTVPAHRATSQVVRTAAPATPPRPPVPARTESKLGGSRWALPQVNPPREMPSIPDLDVPPSSLPLAIFPKEEETQPEIEISKAAPVLVIDAPRMPESGVIEAGAPRESAPPLPIVWEDECTVPLDQRNSGRAAAPLNMSSFLPPALGESPLASVAPPGASLRPEPASLRPQAQAPLPPVDVAKPSSKLAIGILIAIAIVSCGAAAAVLTLPINL